MCGFISPLIYTLHTTGKNVVFLVSSRKKEISPLLALPTKFP